MTKIETDLITLPACYASAFINGDMTGIEDDAEAAHVESIMARLAADGWQISDVARDDTDEAQEARFTNSYHLYDGYQPPEHYCLITGGDVLDYVIIRYVE